MPKARSRYKLVDINDRWLQIKFVNIAVGLAMLFTAHAIAETTILRSLPSDIQKEIEQVRQSCRETGGSLYCCRCRFSGGRECLLQPAFL
jgi:hypothetical protein